MPGNPNAMDDLLLRTFRPGDEEAFYRLNEAWISNLFTLEAADLEVLEDPREPESASPSGAARRWAAARCWR